MSLGWLDHHRVFSAAKAAGRHLLVLRGAMRGVGGCERAAPGILPSAPHQLRPFLGTEQQLGKYAESLRKSEIVKKNCPDSMYLRECDKIRAKCHTR